MTIFEQIKEDLKTAMKAGDRVGTDTLRMLMSDIKKNAVDNGSDRENISDEIAQNVLDKAAKTRKESIKIYTESNRNDLVESEQNEINIIQKYLPSQLTDEELEAIVAKVKSENPSVQGPALMGKIMPLVKGKADPDRIKNLL
jgi:uncharacterized protein YqeY